MDAPPSSPDPPRASVWPLPKHWHAPAHLMEKLGIANNADLIRYAIEHKLFD